MIEEISKTKKVLETLTSIPIKLTPEEYKKMIEFGENLRRESNYRSQMSEISSKDCWVYQN